MTEGELLAHLETEIDQTKVFLVGAHITMADFLSFKKILAHFSGLSGSDKLKHPNVFRWINHMQNLPYIKDMVTKAGLYFEIPKGDEK